MKARLLILFVALLLGLPFQLASAQEPGSFNRYTHSNAAGSMTYMVYTPPGPPTPDRGMVVFLHGAGYDGMRSAVDTQFNELAAREGFVVLYPEFANMGCWGWADSQHQNRDAGQPSLIADITRKVTRDWSVDRQRVWIDGVSCGGAMANVMAATYPDLYAAVGAHASCPYKGSPCLASRSLATDEEAARAIHQAMGPRARIMPFFAVVGSADPAAPPEVTEQVVRSWLGAADLADDSVYDESVKRSPSSVKKQQIPGGRAYEVASYVDADNCFIGERWLIEGMSHAYSGGQNSDRASQVMKSPDVTTASYAFFVAHPMGFRGPGCLIEDAADASLSFDVDDGFDEFVDLSQSTLGGDEVVSLFGEEGEPSPTAVPAGRIASRQGSAPRYTVVWLIPLVLLVVGGFLTRALTQPTLTRV